ncbi:MAG TPA: hypothetical protein VKT77_09085 [Chthonomonadaceae bacterium]|nr:hypothetical protein [Chthonomonadaceae bacterium]
MYYLQVVASGPEAQRHEGPREVVQGPFASASEARAYWTKLTMWFPEGTQGAEFEIVDHESRGSGSVEHTRRR